MGTNCYAVRTRPTLEEPIHIGKSSIGWMFCFQQQDEEYHDPPIQWFHYEDVVEWLHKYVDKKKEYIVLDEYEETVSVEELLEIVEHKQISEKDNPDNFGYGVHNRRGYRFRVGYFS